jgi:hypothetical protein
MHPEMMGGLFLFLFLPLGDEETFPTKQNAWPVYFCFYLNR